MVQFWIKNVMITNIFIVPFETTTPIEENTEVHIDVSETLLVDLKSEFEATLEEGENDQESESDGVVDLYADLFNVEAVDDDDDEFDSTCTSSNVVQTRYCN